MNKISILGLTAIMALGFASCDGYEEPNPAPTTNEQQSIIKPEDVVFTNAFSADQVVDLGQYNNDVKPVTVATVKGVIPAGYEFKTVAQFSVDGTDWYDVKSSVVAAGEDTPDLYNVNINPDDLDGVYKEIVTRDPANKALKFRYKLYTVIGNMQGLVGTEYYTEDFTITPINLGYTIEENYYLIGTAANGQIAQAVKLSHDDEAGVNRYDNPVFSTVVEISGEFTWAVIPESTFAAGQLSGAPYSVWGVAAGSEDALKGELVPTVEGAACAWGKFSATAPYMFTINMYDRTYEWSMAFVNIYCVGTHCKNNPAKALPMGTSDYANYWAYLNLQGSYRLLSEPSRNAKMQWGAGEGTGTLAVGNSPLNHRGFSFVEVNVVKLTYKTTDVTTIGIIGDATPLGWDGSTPMVQDSKNPYIWTLDVTMKDGEMKFRANDGWDVNLGGELGNLTPGGDNIPVKAGNYTITLDLSSVPVTATLVKK